MIAQWIKEKGRKEGLEQGLEQGFQQGHIAMLSRQIRKKFAAEAEAVLPMLDGLWPEDLSELGEYLLDCPSIDVLRHWLEQRTQGNLS